MTKSDRLILLKKIRADRKLAVAKDLSDYQKYIFNYYDADYAGTQSLYIPMSERKQDLDFVHHSVNLSDQYNEKTKDEE